MDIQLLAMTIDETERALTDPAALRFRQYDIAPEAMPPEIVFTLTLARLRAGEAWFWCAPRLYLLPVENKIIGSASFKNSPHDGAVYIGYGVAESYRGRNVATMGVELLVAEGFSQAEVTAIMAETADWNIASQRVLEKASFCRSGSRVDPEDGDLIIWRRER